MATAPVLATPAQQYADASPFPHIVLDGNFADARLRAVAAEARALDLAPQRPFYGQTGKRGAAHGLGPATSALIDEMNSPAFIAWLEELTGIGGLEPDPALFGGGVHRIERGGFLKIHTDFNWHAGLQMHRRVNLLLYLNEDWREEWGGQLELWHPDMSRCGARISPQLGRMVIFSTTDESYHGHPEPLACPEGVSRNSIALYYYSAEPASASRSELTNYRARPGERFSGFRRLLHRLKRAAHR